MFFCSACFNKVSSFFLIKLNMVFCLCCTKGMPSVCESGPEGFSTTLNKLYVYTKKKTQNKSSALTWSLSSSSVFQNLSK